LRPLNQSSASLGWYLRTYKEGFTPGEKQYLEKRHEELQRISGEFLKIYFRLKR
jgi:hypothetical protein